jgi:hypothetical protein
MSELKIDAVPGKQAVRSSDGAQPASMDSLEHCVVAAVQSAAAFMLAGGVG